MLFYMTYFNNATEVFFLSRRLEKSATVSLIKHVIY